MVEQTVIMRFATLDEALVEAKKVLEQDKHVVVCLSVEKSYTILECKFE